MPASIPHHSGWAGRWSGPGIVVTKPSRLRDRLATVGYQFGYQNVLLIKVEGMVRASTCVKVVDLVAAYSNRPDVLGDLEYTLAALAKAQAATGEAEHVSVRSERSMRAWRVSHRLTEEDVQLLIKEYHAGALRQELADTYKISLSSVGRLLRKHGGRLKDAPN
ncbi:MAG: hypothetical protein LC775_16975 [Acidobacteria bacterium]|nr:hypothetical protein [Acidobacteriota bacterium]